MIAKTKLMPGVYIGFSVTFEGEIVGKVVEIDEENDEIRIDITSEGLSHMILSQKDASMTMELGRKRI